ncbi:MAG: UDP-N-acetylmuramoyl-L-alanine--D-glutamate ligase [Clostridia bacterium]|nr:UDP-N-acetylmuramoyl-L-alanine--D-glutamate ligase [Clostridia bacterium]
MYFKSQKFLVAGMSKSGKASAEFLLVRGAEVYVYDDVISDNINAVINELQNSGAKHVTFETLENAINSCDVLVLSPGIPIDNALPIAFRKLGKAIIGEEELGALFLRATAIAVTGTNGKTTTVSMIENVLKSCNKRAVACGNVGTPLVGEVEKLSFDDYAVIEISSFQLETLFSLRPHIAVISNISEDHLNRHYNMDNYIYLKSRLIRPLKESEYAVLNYDDEIVKSLAAVTKAKVVYFSIQKKVNGAYLEDGYIIYDGEKVLNVSDMQINGVHNVYNALATVTCAKLLNLPNEQIAQALYDFKGVKHRNQLIAEINGVKYVNDSKGTNVDATVKAIESVSEPTVLLLGGKDKGEDYEVLFKKINSSSVVHAVIYGENRIKLINAAIKHGFLSFSTCSDFYHAINLARLIAKSGQTVLLSPASSSFDAFSNYEERGEAFIKAVEEFK